MGSSFPATTSPLTGRLERVCLILITRTNQLFFLTPGRTFSGCPQGHPPLVSVSPRLEPIPGFLGDILSLILVPNLLFFFDFALQDLFEISPLLFSPRSSTPEWVFPPPPFPLFLTSAGLFFKPFACESLTLRAAFSLFPELVLPMSLLLCG